MDADALVSKEHEQANYHRLVMDIAWFGLAVPATARFLSIYAIRLDASAMLLGWLSALPAIICLATSWLVVWWRKKFPDTVRAQVLPGFGYRLVFLLPALTPFFPDDWQLFWLLLAVSLPAIPQGISSVLFLVLMREGIENGHLTSLVSRRSLSFNVAVAIGTLGFGLWLEEVSFPINYQVMYVVAFGLSLMSLLNVSRMHILWPEPILEPIPEPTQSSVKVWQAPAFQRITFMTVITHATFFLIVPIIPLRLVDEMGADEAFMSVFALAELGSAALMAVFTARIVRHIGTRPAISFGMVGTGGAAILLAVAPNLPFTLLSAALSGAAWTMAAISLFGFFSDNTPSEHITRYSTMYNQVVMLSIFVGPLLGSQLASTSLSLVTVIWIGAGLRFVAGALAHTDLIGRGKRKSQPAVVP